MAEFKKRQKKKALAEPALYLRERGTGALDDQGVALRKGGAKEQQRQWKKFHASEAPIFFPKEKNHKKEKKKKKKKNVFLQY
jgi:hypothetical protein